MKEAIKISAIMATALLLAACAKKEEAAAPMPEPAASAPVEAAPVEAAPVEAAPVEAAPMGEEPAVDAAADADTDTERAGGDRVAPQ
jgi:ribonuclease E